MTAVPPISPWMLLLFRRIVRRYFQRHFHAVRLNAASDFSAISGPLIIYANHSSWWDPMIAFLLGAELFGTRSHYAPMDASALSRYRVLSRLGVFPVEMNTARGAVQFMRTGEAVLAAGGVLWVTPQGRFADPRERPLAFKPGLAALASRVALNQGACTVLPLAIEYPFWDERLPECLLRLGTPIRIGSAADAEAVEPALRVALAGEMDLLAQLALSRTSAPFRTVLAGSAGTGGFYGFLKRTQAAFLRRPYVADHNPHLAGPIPRAPRGEETQASAPLSPAPRTSEAR